MLRKCSGRLILFMKDIMLHTMCLIRKIPDAEFDPEKYWRVYVWRSELSADHARMYSRVKSSQETGERLCVSNFVNRLVTLKRQQSCNLVLLGAEEKKFNSFLIESHQTPKSEMRSLVSNSTLHKWKSNS